MYILKNAYLNIVRSKGRNLLIGIIITVITIGACITITINKSGNALVDSYNNSNPLEASFNLNIMSFRNTDDNQKENFELMTLDDINKIGNLDQVESYYYTLQSNLNSNEIEVINYEELFKKPETENSDTEVNDKEIKKHINLMNGDFKIVAYSDIAYNEDFINGNKQLLEGQMISKDSTDNVVVISEELAQENNLEIGNEITFINTEDTTKTYKLKVIGIYSVSNDTDTNFMQSNTSNQLFTNLTVLNNILNDNGVMSEYQENSAIVAKFYVDHQNITSFEKEVREIGISDYYSIVTNEEEVTATLNPIKNLASFSFTFLIIILIVGGIVLTLINLFNIRERKYEIGVLRAIGMTKMKVTLQIVSEIFIVALVSLVIGTGIGTLLSQPMSNYMLKNEISSIKEKNDNIQNNFGGKEFNRPGFQNRIDINNQNSNIDYVDVLDVKIDFITIIELFGVSLLLTILSGCTAVMFVNKYEPNKILQNRG